MDHVVREVAREEPGADPGGVAGAEDQVEDPEHDRPQRHAHGGRHHQAQGIVRVVVVDAVDDPVHPRAETVLGLEVEHDPVQPVLEQRPQRVAADRQRDRRRDARARELPRGQQDHGGREDQHRHAGCTRERTSSSARVEHRRGGPQHVGPARRLPSLMSSTQAIPKILLPDHGLRNRGAAISPRRHRVTVGRRAAVLRRLADLDLGLDFGGGLCRRLDLATRRPACGVAASPERRECPGRA